MAVIKDLGKVTPLWRGEYRSDTEYEINDLVLFTDGCAYWHIGKNPTTGVDCTDSTVWDIAIDAAFLGERVQEAETAAEEAQAFAQIAENAKNSMIYVSFTVESDGCVWIENPEVLGDVTFMLNGNGEMEVDL